MVSFCSSTACLRQASRIVTSAFSEGVQVNGVLFYVRLERVRVNGDSVFIGFVSNSLLLGASAQSERVRVPL